MIKLAGLFVASLGKDYQFSIRIKIGMSFLNCAHCFI